MAYNTVENLEVWRRSKNLAVAIYSVLSETKDYGLRNQMTRAAVSIPSNIAEGYERGTTADRRQFYRVAKGSAAELRTQLIIAGEIGVVGRNDAGRLTTESSEIAAMLQGLIRSLPEKE